MKIPVYFMDLRATWKDNFLTKLARLVDVAGLAQIVKPRDLVAVKLHFGEQGNTAFVRPPFVVRLVESIKDLKGAPFLTDTNTLYTGTRSNAVHHLHTAVQNGFAYSVVRAPIIIADGLRGNSSRAIVINQKHFKEVHIAHEIVQADALLSVVHFKAHELTGFGGSLKNLGMGCAARRGKLAQHSSVAPKVKKMRCIGCGDCVAHCPQKAISLNENKALIAPKKCIGCGECILVCPNQAIQVQWNRSIPVFMENVVEYALGAVSNKAGKCLFVNFITNVSPACDCNPYNDAPIVRDIGVVASSDPVAIDQASADLVNAETGLEGTALTCNLEPGHDKFIGLYPKVDWKQQLAYAEAIGLGSRQYELHKI